LIVLLVLPFSESVPRGFRLCARSSLERSEILLWHTPAIPDCSNLGGGYRVARFQGPNPNIAGGGFGMITGSVLQPTSPYGAFQSSSFSGRLLVITGRFNF